jgi:hypothetical protein
MVQLDNRVVNKATVVHMNRASLTLELAPNERVMVTRRVFNIIRENPDTPMYQVEREYLGQQTSWVAIPMTL